MEIAKLKDMDIRIVEIEQDVAQAISNSFLDVANVKVVHADLHQELRDRRIDAVVAPGNSYGIMDGTFDLRITEWFGWGSTLHERLKCRIVCEYLGEIPVGHSVLVQTGTHPRQLIYTPTMRYPKEIIDPEIIYHCTRSALLCAIENNLTRIILPAFGGGAGRVSGDEIGYQMRKAYEQLLHPPADPENLNWDYVGMLNADA